MVEEVSGQQEAAGGDDEEANVDLLGMKKKNTCQRSDTTPLAELDIPPVESSVPSKGLQPGVPPSG